MKRGKVGGKWGEEGWVEHTISWWSVSSYGHGPGNITGSCGNAWAHSELLTPLLESMNADQKAGKCSTLYSRGSRGPLNADKQCVSLGIPAPRIPSRSTGEIKKAVIEPTRIQLPISPMPNPRVDAAAITSVQSVIG